MHLPRIKSSPNLGQPKARSASRRCSEPARVPPPKHTASACTQSLPLPAQLCARAGQIPMQTALALPISHVAPSDPVSVRVHARALIASFDSAPEELDQDPAQYHSVLSGHLRAWKALFARVLQGVVREPKIVGLAPWLQEMCHARIKSPQTQRPHAENLVRRLFEPIAALYLARETDNACTVDVSCDQAKKVLPDGRLARSSDLRVVNSKTQAIRNIEVTSVGPKVRRTHDLERAVQHVVDKVQGSGKGTHEGVIALNWHDEALPETILRQMLHNLNSPRREPWVHAQTQLDRLVLMRYNAEHPDPTAEFVKEDGVWYATNGPFLEFDEVLPPLPAKMGSPTLTALEAADAASLQPIPGGV